MPARERRAKSGSRPTPLVLDGWTFLAWRDFDRRWVALLRTVTDQRRRDPHETPASPEATLLAALVRVIRDRIARDPNAPEFRLRGALRTWRRVKFLGRLRLFYRFSSAHHIVVLTWLDDENTLRKQGARTDPYSVFAAMLARGEIPVRWSDLVAGASHIRSPFPPTDR